MIYECVELELNREFETAFLEASNVLFNSSTSSDPRWKPR